MLFIYYIKTLYINHLFNDFNSRQVFGRNERVVDLIGLLDVIKNYSASHRRSFDYTSSRVKKIFFYKVYLHIL